MSLPVPIPPVLRSWLGWQTTQELSSDFPLVDTDLITLVHRVLYALDECFPAWSPEFTTQVLDYLYRRCELSSYLYTRVACSGSLGATPPLLPGSPVVETPPIKALTLFSFTSTSPLNLLGSSVSGVSLLWQYSREVDTQTVDGVSLSREVRELPVLSPTISSSTTYSLVAQVGAQQVRGTTSLSFVNHILVGVAEAGTDLSPLLPQPLKAVETRVLTFTVKAGPTQKVKVAFPLRLGMEPTTLSSPQAIYKVGDFEGGFIETIVSYTNPAGFTEDYVLAESVNVNLGTLKVSVT